MYLRGILLCISGFCSLCSVLLTGKYQILLNIASFNIHQLKLMCGKMKTFTIFCGILMGLSQLVSANEGYLPAQHTSPPVYANPVYGQLGCCRSTFPSKIAIRELKSAIYSLHKPFIWYSYSAEHGSCRSNADCGSRTQPYCSGFGYCTQVWPLNWNFNLMSTNALDWPLF